MTANMYSEPALAQFINTYAPINFGELFRIGAAQKEEMDRAAQLFGSQLLKFGEFKSQSGIDTENYYNQTTGRSDMQEAITQMASNPEYMKDAQNRANLLSIINSVDYAGLAKLKLNAENLDKRAQVIALMKAAGKYNEAWDDIDIANWDTSKQGIMTDMAPVEFMNINQLSEPYFNELTPGFLRTENVGGTRYIVTGNNEEDLMTVASAKFNDLISTPQGDKYYRQFLQLNQGNEEAAKSQFINTVAQSQLARTLRPKYDVDPTFIEELRASAKGVRAGAKGAGLTLQEQSIVDLSTMLMRTNMINNLTRFGGLNPEERTAVATGLMTQELFSKGVSNMLQNVASEYVNSEKRSGATSAIRKTLNLISTPLSPITDESLLAEGVGTMEKAYKITNSTSEMLLGSDLVFGVMGIDGGSLDYSRAMAQNSKNTKSKDIWSKREDSMSRIRLAWYSDVFRDVIVKGAGSTSSDNSQVYHNRKVYIPLQQLRDIGFKSISSGDFSGIMGSKIVAIGDVLNKLEIEILQERGELGEVTESKAESKLTRTKIDTTDMYLELDASSPISIGNSEATITRNAIYEDKVRKISANLKYSQAEYSAQQYME